MELTEHERKRMARQVRDGALAPDGPKLDHWGCLDLAQAIEHECNRASSQGLPKLSLHMDIPDAVKLASALRRLALLGG